MVEETFGKRIKRLRKGLNLTQTQLAKKCNLSKGTIAMWEVDKRGISTDGLIQLSELFQVSLDYLISGHESKYCKFEAEKVVETKRIISEVDKAKLDIAIKILNDIKEESSNE